MSCDDAKTLLEKEFSRRAILLGSGQLVLVGFLIRQMRELQLQDSEKFFAKEIEKKETRFKMFEQENEKKQWALDNLFKNLQNTFKNWQYTFKN